MIVSSSSLLSIIRQNFETPNFKEKEGKKKKIIATYNIHTT